MLRLREVVVRSLAQNFVAGDEAPKEILEVVFEGAVGEFADARITLHMNPRPTDAALLADAHKLLASVAAQLHREHAELP